MNASNRNSGGNKEVINKVKQFMETVEGVFIAIISSLIDMIAYPLKRIFKLGSETKAGKVVAGILSFAIAIAATGWAFDFVQYPPEGYSGSEVAVIVGAVLTPVTAIVTSILMRFVFASKDGE